LARGSSRRENRQIIYGRARRCLFTSGTGVALLSALDDEIIERLYRLAAARELFKRHEISLKSVQAEIAAVRQRGYIASRNCLRPGRMVVAMPLPVTYSGRRLALGCSGPVDEIEPRIGDSPN
jgi:DNA-binding IclR family transcriptional regulator